MSKEIVAGILLAIKEINDEPSKRNVRSLKNGDIAEWRPICKYINRYCGVALLDAFTRYEIKELAYNFILEYRIRNGIE